MEVDLFTRPNKKISNRYRKHRQHFMNQIRQQRFNNSYSITERKKHYDALADKHASYYFSTPSVKDHLKYYRKALRKQESNQKSRKELNKLLTVRINQKFSDHVTPNALVYAQQLNQLELQALNKKSSTSLNRKSRKSIDSHTSSQNKTHHSFAKRSQYFKKIKPLDSTLSNQICPSNATEYPKTIQQQDFEQNNSEKKKNSHSKAKTKVNKQTQEAQSCGEKHVDSSERMKTTSKDNKGSIEKSNKLAEDLHKQKHQKWLKFLQEKKQLLSKGKQINPQVEIPGN